MATAFYKYGSYQFEAGECDLVRTNVVNTLSGRGRRITKQVTHHIRATLISDSQANLSAKIQAIQAAFSIDYQDAGLYLDAGVPSQHLLINDAFCISGVKVLQRSFPEGGGDEYVTARTFQATIMAEYDDADEHLLEWEESLEFTGTCGPIYEWEEGWFGPERFQTAESSIQWVHQRGSAVGYGAIPLPGAPLFPAYEHLDRRQVSSGSPKFMGLAYRYYPTRWSYTFSSNTPLLGP